MTGVIGKVSFHGIANMIRPGLFRSAVLVALLIVLVSAVCGSDNNGFDLTIRFDQTAEGARAFDADGGELAAVSSFWFAWFAFHPETEVFSADNAGAD